MLKFLAILIAVMLIAGCKEGGSGLSSLFDFGSNSGSSSSSSISSSSGLTNSSAPIPEPSTVALLGIGLAGLAVAMLRKKKHH